MTPIDRLLDDLRAAARAAKWEAVTLARHVGLGENTLRDFWKPSWNPRADTIRVLCRALLPDGGAP